MNPISPTSTSNQHLAQESVRASDVDILISPKQNEGHAGQLILIALAVIFIIIAIKITCWWLLIPAGVFLGASILLALFSKRSKSSESSSETRYLENQIALIIALIDEKLKNAHGYLKDRNQAGKLSAAEFHSVIELTREVKEKRVQIQRLISQEKKKKLSAKGFQTALNLLLEMRARCEELEQMRIENQILRIERLLQEIDQNTKLSITKAEQEPMSQKTLGYSLQTNCKIRAELQRQLQKLKARQ